MQQRELGRMAMMSSSPDWMAFLESASPIVHHLEQASPGDSRNAQACQPNFSTVFS